jgi:hypothetical protein
MNSVAQIGRQLDPAEFKRSCEQAKATGRYPATSVCHPAGIQRLSGTRNCQGQRRKSGRPGRDPGRDLDRVAEAGASKDGRGSVCTVHNVWKIRLQPRRKECVYCVPGLQGKGRPRLNGQQQASCGLCRRFAKYTRPQWRRR